MRKFLKIKKAATLTAITLTSLFATVSCKKSDSNQPVDSKQHFTIASWTKDSQYIASVPSLADGSLTFKGNGIEAQGSRYFWHKGYVYIMNLPEKKFIQYQLNADGTVKQLGYLLTDGIVPNYIQSINAIDDNTLMVFGANDSGDDNGRVGWARISTSDFRVVAKGVLQVPSNSSRPGLKFFVGKGFADNGKFILGGYFYDSDTKSYDAAGVKALVYNYPAMDNMTVITSNATNGGLGYDYLHSLDKDEDGNHYFVVSAGKYWTGLGGHSGVLRIKKGEANFDPTYFYDVTAEIGRQACLMGLNYVGNGIAFGTIQYEDIMTSVRDRITNVAQVVKLDLKNKKATVMNTPLSPVGMVRSPLVFKGKYYTGIAPINQEAFIYEFDPAGDANSFKKGTALDGGGSVQVQLIAPHPTTN